MASSFVVYKASAGSGKTFTLAVQYIKLLITNKPQEYQHTLAVTFTNKATAEMKERIMEQLYGIGQGLESSDGYVDALHKALDADGQDMDTETIRERCRWALHEILHDYSRFRVETIDSFFQSVLRNLAHELGLSAKMQVDLNDKEILNQAVDNIIDSLGRKDGDVLPWIDNYIKERIENGDRWDVRDDIKQFAKCIFTEDFMRRDETMRRKLTSSENLKAYRSDMYQMERQILEQMQEAAKKLQEEINASGLNLEDDITNGRYIRSFINKVENFQDTLAKSAKDDEYFWTASLDKMVANPTDALKKAKRNNPSLVSAAKALMPKLCELNDLANKGMRVYFTIRLALKHLNPLRLLNHIDEEVTEITNETNRFILAKTPILLSRLIEGSDAPFVFERMGTLFHHVMIDEFQDTSRLQWQNFKVLMLENQSQGGSDLLVGDIKQSIYRWRNGDWGILANIGTEMASHEPDIKNLGTNFRSEFNIIDFNNKFFAHASNLINGKDFGIDIHKDLYGDVAQQCSKKDQKGWVRTAVYEVDNKEWEAQMLDDLCQQVTDLHEHGIPYEEMCILQRDRTHVDKLIEHFRTNLPDVPLVSDEAFKLGSSRSLGMLICALKVLCNGAKDPVSTHLLMQQYLIDILGQEVNTSDYALSKPEDILPSDFYEHTDELATYPMYELCEEIYRKLDISKIKGEDSYLMSFYDELAAYLQTAPGDIASFLEYWDNVMKERAIPACKVNGISIITIHKSKGLQYHTVLMPFCNFKFEKTSDDDLLWCEPRVKPFDGMEVLPIQPGSKMRNSLFAREMNYETLQKDIEELNALYVAFTRAEKNLLVWCKNEKINTAGSITSKALLRIQGGPILEEKDSEEEKARKQQEWIYLEEDAQDGVTIYTQGSPVYETKGKESKSTKKENRLTPNFEQQTITMSSHHRQHDFKQSTEGMLFIEELDQTIDHELLRTADGLTYAQQGSLLHEIFSQIERAEQLEEVIKQYVDSGVLTNGKQVERITKLIGRALRKKEAKHWFDGTYTIHNECEIAFYNKEKGKAEVLRPDRVMMNEEEIIVIDFKFGKPHPEDYHDQVKGYMNLLQEMYPQHKISGHIWYIYRNQIVNVD